MKTNPTVLVVDDDPNIRQVVQLYLAKEGFTVRTADRGDTALQQVRTDPPDLILLDVMLPGLDGRQVLTQVPQSTQVPSLTVDLPSTIEIALTGHAPSQAPQPTHTSLLTFAAMRETPP